MKVYFKDLPEKANGAPWGGGNGVLHAIAGAVIDSGGVIVKKIEDCDLVYIHDVRGAELLIDGANRLSKPIVLRAGDMGTHGKPDILTKLKEALPKVTKVITPSQWGKWKIEREKPSPKIKVIKNEPDLGFFPPKPVKLVTHHWSDNPMKGAFMYQQIQAKIEQWGFEFHFIGRPCFKPNKHVKLWGTLDKVQVNSVLRQMDWYITCSTEEAGPNHVLEAQACNLPLIAYDSHEMCGVGEYAYPCILFEDIEELQPLLDINRFKGYKHLGACYLEQFKLALTTSAPDQVI